MKRTGERVLTAAGGFNPTWQRHVAAYSLADGFLPHGRLLDLGCGIGHSYHLLAPRETVGADISAEALQGQERETVVADMRVLPFGDGEFSSVLSVQSLEHVPDPERVLAEVARVLDPGGTAMFVTPNRLTLGRPDEIIDPYHFREFDHAELAEACGQHFGQVRILGLFGSPRYMEIVNEERAKLERMLAKDPLRLRRLVPIRAKQWLYDAVLLRNREKPDPRAEAIDVDDFELRDTDLLEALDVVAICDQAKA
jgi:SAM-dependent methyltransferase